MTKYLPITNDYNINVTVINDSDHVMSEITIQHPSNDKN